MRKINDDSYFVLYANCIPVKGAARSTVSDLQRGKYYYIPNDLYEILLMVKEKKLPDIYRYYGPDNEKVLDEYFDFLLEMELGFIDNDPAPFIDLDSEWDFPAKVTNSIIDVDENYFEVINYKKAITELSGLNCFCIQIRCFKEIKVETIEKLIGFTVDTRIKEIRLVLKYESGLKEYLVNHLLEKHKRISQVVFFSCQQSSVENIKSVQFTYLNVAQLNEKDCGQVCPGLFLVNVQHYTEAVNYNTCLNRKISLDLKGNIKNCPSQDASYGNINSSTFLETLANQHFQKLWKIKKDDIKICKDCEHRYICTDCRIFIQDKQDLNSKPSKCTYDPYTASWN